MIKVDHVACVDASWWDRLTLHHFHVLNFIFLKASSKKLVISPPLHSCDLRWSFEGSLRWHKKYNFWFLNGPRGIVMLGEKTSVLEFKVNRRIFRGSSLLTCIVMHTPIWGIADFANLLNARWHVHLEVYLLEVPFSEKFQAETKPIPMKWQLQKSNTKPIFILPKYRYLTKF